MEKENRLIAPQAPEPAEEQAQAPVAEKPRPWSFRSKDAGRYVRYVLFLVAIGMVYIWNSHVTEKQVKEEERLRKEIADAKAEYKTMHARLSAGTRRQVIFEKVDTLGLRVTSTNVYKITTKQ
jgi:Bacteriodetes cell division protein (FtsL-like)